MIFLAFVSKNISKKFKNPWLSDPEIRNKRQNVVFILMKRRHLKGFCESQAIVCAYSLFVIFTYNIKLGWLAAYYILRFLIRKIYTTYCIVYNKVHIKYFFLSLKCCRNDNYPASSLVSLSIISNFAEQRKKYLKLFIVRSFNLSGKRENCCCGYKIY